MSARSEKNPVARELDSQPRARVTGAPATGEGCSPEVIEEAVRGLSGCSDNALSQAVCRGIVDPQRVVDWTNRTERLLRFQFDRAELRSEIPAVARLLAGLLADVELPTSSSPESITSGFVASLVGLRESLAEDVAAAFAGDPAATGYEEIAVAYPAIRALSIHRIAHELYARQVPLIPRIMSEYAHDRTGIDIHPGARIGRHFSIDHGTGVVIGETTVIGQWVKIYQGVTLGALSVAKQEDGSWREGRRHPLIEDHVTLYAGATILGGDTVIGAGSVIGGNVWLTRSVDANTKVMINPPYLVFEDLVNGKTEKEPLPPSS